MPSGRGADSYALCTMCIGVGQGIALALEKIEPRHTNNLKETFHG